jgi:hypothetical protein
MNVILEELSSCDLLSAALVFRMAEGLFASIGPVVFGIDYLGFGQETLQTTLKLKFAGSGDILAAMLVYTSIFIFTPLSVKIHEIASGNPWISKFTKHQA